MEDQLNRPLWLRMSKHFQPASTQVNCRARVSEEATGYPVCAYLGQGQLPRTVLSRARQKQANEARAVGFTL